MVPKELKEKLSEDPWMKRCCYKYCGQPTEWHHVFTYAGKQIQEEFNIVPACKTHHDQATPHKFNYKREVQEYFEWVALQRMTSEDMRKYSKFNDLTTWVTRANYLSLKANKYGW